MRVAVIGAGIIGASVARELAVSGVAVTIFERHHPGSGTSGTTFGWVNSHEKRPDSYHRLNVEGCRQHQRLAEDTAGSPPWFFPTGNLEWADDAAGQQALEARVRRLQDLDYPCRWLDADGATELEPDLRLPPGVTSAAFFPEEGYVAPALLLARLLGEAKDRGAVLRCPIQVLALEPAPGGVDVCLADGERQRFDRAVSCVGRWTSQLGATFGAGVPLADPDQPGGPAVGLLGYTAPTVGRLSRILTTPRINVRPDGGGRLVLQALDLDGRADPASPPGPSSHLGAVLVDRMAEVLALADQARLDAVRVGQRALPADGRTVAGFADHGSCYVVATHSGITLGPLLGRLAAAEILDEQPAPLLADFRPGRFSGSGGPVTVTAARRPGEQ